MRRGLIVGDCCSKASDGCPGPKAASVAVNAASARPISTLREGEVGVICESRLSPSDAALLRAMGLCMNATVRLCRAGRPTVVAVEGVRGECSCGGACRIGLARPLAERIFVTPAL